MFNFKDESSFQGGGGVNVSQNFDYNSFICQISAVDRY